MPDSVNSIETTSGLESFRWNRMSLEEFAELERRNGAKLSQIDGIWWREVRPFFFRPLFPFTNLSPASTRPPSRSRFGGFQHLVSDPSLSNSFMNFLVFDRIQQYAFEELGHDYRKNTRKGLRHFSFRPVTEIEEFVVQGHRVYTSFYNRTGYPWKKERQDQRSFECWAREILSFPKVLVLGAYDGPELCAISISYLVEDVIIYATNFSTTESLRLRVSEAMLHVIRDIASRCVGPAYIYMGPSRTKEGIDAFKVNRGCKNLAQPAFFRMNPLLLPILKRFRGSDYRKLLGTPAEATEGWRDAFAEGA